MASRHSIPLELRLAHLYLLTSSDEAQLKSKREALRKDIMPLLRTLEADEDGNFFYKFPDPIQLGEESYTGLMAQRRVSEYVNDDTAMEIIKAHGLEDRCLKSYMVTEVNYDELYACNQEGIISDEDVDSIIETSENYALVKVKQ